MAKAAIKRDLAHIKAYITRAGKTQYRPSVSYGMALLHNDHGFCLACGGDQSGVEPDARKYECDNCGEDKVYGIEELALMGLLF